MMTNQEIAENLVKLNRCGFSVPLFSSNKLTFTIIRGTLYSEGNGVFHIHGDNRLFSLRIRNDDSDICCWTLTDGGEISYRIGEHSQWRTVNLVHRFPQQLKTMLNSRQETYLRSREQIFAWQNEKALKQVVIAVQEGKQ